MATQVAIEDLETWLGNQPENTVDTPYEIEITGLTVNNVNSIKTALKSSFARNKYVDLRDTELPVGLTDVTSLFEQIYTLVYSPVFPEGITMFRQCFSDCTNLKEAPVIPSSAINIPYMFSNCSSLIVPPDIPESVKNMQGTFADCTGITKAKKFPNTITVVQSAYDGCSNLSYKPLIPNTAVLTEDCYRGVTTTRWGGSLEQVNSWIPNQTNEFEIVVIGTDRVIYGINVNNLSSWLNNQPENTTETPFEIDVVGITEPNYPSVKSALLANPTKYVDLGYTVIDYMIVLSSNYQNCTSLVGAPTFGAGTDYLNYQFRGCSNLKKVPTLPSSVLSLSAAFAECSSLTELVTIPSGVTDIGYMFLNCVSLQSAPEIPNSVTNMRSAFQGCVLLNDDNIVIPDSVTNMQGSFSGCFSLESIKKIPSSVTVMIDAFYNCTSLRKIERFEVPLNTLKNNSNFENAFEGCTSLEQIGYKINETNWHIFHLNFRNTIRNYTIVSGKVYGISEEEITEEAIPSRIIQAGLITDELILKLPDYTDELWFPVAGEQIENTIQKMLTYKYGVFNKGVLQPDKKNFVLWAQDPNNFQTNLPIASQNIPVGFIMPQYKKVDAIGWLYLDGRDTTNTADELETVYPALYAYLGNSNVLPDYREFALVGAEENTTDTIATHDVYTEGQAKDDALQNITGYFQIRKMSNGANAVTSRSGAFTLSDQSSQADGFDFSGGEGKIHRVSFNSKNVTRNDANANVTRGKRKAVYFYIKAV